MAYITQVGLAVCGTRNQAPQCRSRSSKQRSTVRVFDGMCHAHGPRAGGAGPARYSLESRFSTEIAKVGPSAPIPAIGVQVRLPCSCAGVSTLPPPAHRGSTVQMIKDIAFSGAYVHPWESIQVLLTARLTKVRWRLEAHP